MAQTLAEFAAQSCFPVTPRVFVSRPAVLSSDQTTRLQDWLRRLELLEFQSVTLDRDAYNMPPWGQIRAAINEADGLLILGFRQLHVNEGQWRTGTFESRDVGGWWATPWNHIEAAFGLMAGVPVLVAPETGVAEGVFSRDAWGGDLFGVHLEADLEAASVIAPSSDTAGAVVNAWARAVKARVANSSM